MEKDFRDYHCPVLDTTVTLVFHVAVHTSGGVVDKRIESFGRCQSACPECGVEVRNGRSSSYEWPKCPAYQIATKRSLKS